MAYVHRAIFAEDLFHPASTYCMILVTKCMSRSFDCVAGKRFRQSHVGQRSDMPFVEASLRHVPGNWPPWE